MIKWVPWVRDPKDPRTHIGSGTHWVPDSLGQGPIGSRTHWVRDPLGPGPKDPHWVRDPLGPGPKDPFWVPGSWVPDPFSAPGYIFAFLSFIMKCWKCD